MPGTLTRTLALFLGAAAAVGAKGLVLDPELERAIAQARALREQGRNGPAEATLEAVTRQRPHDPRGWFALGNLRVALESRRGATYAYHRAAGLGTERMRDRIRKRLEAAGLEPFEDPVVTEDWDDFLRVALAGACRGKRKAEQRREAVVVGHDAACPEAPGEAPPRPEAYRISRDLLVRAARRSEAWIRERAVRHARLEDIAGKLLRAFRKDPDSGVRRALLDRLSCRAGGLGGDAAALDMLRRFAQDPDFEVRRDTWALLHFEGQAPALSGPDFSQLVRHVDRGWASQDLAVAAMKADPAAMIPHLKALLDEPRYGGKSTALSLLITLGGVEGQLAAARSMLQPNMALAEQRGLMRHAMRWVGEQVGVDLGDDAAAWVRNLEALKAGR